jgi:propanol-preferring alcohol dehydrogenase
MVAAIYNSKREASSAFVTMTEVAKPDLIPGYLLLRVLACGVCRTDLHIVEADLPALMPQLIPGHQIVGEVIDGATESLPLGCRVGVGWMGGVDGDCWFCAHNMENLCDRPTFTGYSVNGGYAEYAHTAPLLCAGVIGFRSLRVAGVQHGERVGLFGYGSSASLLAPILQSWNCEVYVSSRGASHRAMAESQGAIWVGDEDDKPPVALDRAITFAPSGKVVVSALSSLRKGGVVAINAIHLDQMPSFNYDSLLWGERQIRSVANMTRKDATDFIQLAQHLKITPRVTTFPLAQANAALLAVKNEDDQGSVVLLP